MRKQLLFAGLIGATFAAGPARAEDPHLWLEEVEGRRALEWVGERNTHSEGLLSSDARFDELQAKLKQVYEATDRIPYVSKMGGFYYNLWQDANNPRGIWRRTTLQSYKTDSPNWETLLDLDKLGEAEGVSWVWGGSTCLRPDFNRCLIQLSRGGADATVVREFDLASKTFVGDGFELPEAKSDVAWRDIDHIYVGTDFGAGSMTESGYPRIAKLWTRGTPLSSATTIYEGEPQDIAVVAFRTDGPGTKRDFVYRGLTFYSNELYERSGKGLTKVPKPDDANANVHGDWLFIELRTDWEHNGTTYLAGSALAVPYAKWMKGKAKPEVLFVPNESSSLDSLVTTKSHVLINVLDDVKTRTEVLTPGKKGWTRAALPTLDDVGALGTVRARAVDSVDSDEYFLDVTGYATPSTFAMGQIGKGAASPLKQLPAQFNADGLEVSQHFATSKDGTKVPYFQVAKSGLSLDGSNPTLLYGYGGFEVSLLPGYSPGVGLGWLERGGVYVVANIRGGGEYGPRWHQAALKDKRHRAYEDFAAVAEDLVARKVTTQAKLGALGGSNGGLLMGNMITLYPDHFGAIVCKVPLLDMQRYHKLLAGASWVGEYGNPDFDDQWSYIQTFSPYHNLSADRSYPRTLFTTSTRDDRVHPGHARKMAAAMLALGQDVIYWENLEGGHGGAADAGQRAKMDALGYTFLWQTLTAE